MSNNSNLVEIKNYYYLFPKFIKFEYIDIFPTNHLNPVNSSVLLGKKNKIKDIKVHNY